MSETNNFSDSVIFKENGQLKAQCSDCNKVLSLMNGRQEIHQEKVTRVTRKRN